MLSKRGILAKLAKIYDPLGLVSPKTLSSKLIYHAVCYMKGAWDGNLSHDLAKLWVKWESRLPKSFTIARSLVAHREEIERIDLHSFADMCAHGVTACVYAVIRQASGTNQDLTAARSRLAKQGLTIPCLELVTGHMAVNLVDNLRDALDGLPVRSTYCWLDSSVALYWIRGQGEYKQFVANRMQKINKEVVWHYVPTADDPADLASRGGHIEHADLWWHGPRWLASPELWPVDALNEPSEESQTEAKLVQKVLGVAVNKKNEVEEVLHKFQYRKLSYLCLDAKIHTQFSPKPRNTMRPGTIDS